MLKCLILKNLIPSTSRSPIVQISIVVSNIFANFLKLKYLLTNKWRCGSKFLKDFDFVDERYYNQFDYFCIYENTFKFKLTNRRKLAYLYKCLKITTKYFKPKLQIFFVVECKKTSKAS